ncbi:MAG: hypothetical protein ACREFO_05885 [Acetobacteraceae bacterium]
MTISIEQAVTRLAEIDLDLHHELYMTLKRAAVAIEREAKREIGHYQPARGPFISWAPLRPRTVREKTHLGYSPPDNPLKRTGTLRASIDHEVMTVAPGMPMEAEIGANGVVAVAQSVGAPSRNLPARDFLGHAAVRLQVPIIEEVGNVAMMVFGRRGGASTRFL